MATDAPLLNQEGSNAEETIVAGVAVRLVGDTAMFQAGNPGGVQDVVAGIIELTGRCPVTMHDVGGVVPPYRLIVLGASSGAMVRSTGSAGGWAQD